MNLKVRDAVVVGVGVLSTSAALLLVGAGVPIPSPGAHRIRTATTRVANGPSATSTQSSSPVSSSVSSSVDSVETPSEPERDPKDDKVPQLVIGKGTRVAVFGDSMVEAGFSARLQTLAEERGATLSKDGWGSSTTTMWSHGERLSTFLARARPDVVFIVLGSNEVYLASPQAIAPRIRAIVRAVSPRTCVWVGPPIWKGETGIVEQLRRNVAPCRFFDSSRVEIARGKDSIHPTLPGGSKWANAVWESEVAARDSEAAFESP